MHLMCFFSQVYQFKCYLVKLIHLIDTLEARKREELISLLNCHKEFLSRKKWELIGVMK